LTKNHLKIKIPLEKILGGMMNKKIKKIIFDFDGVLYNSTEKGIEKMLQVAKLLNLPNLTTKEIIAKWGASLVDLGKYFEKTCGWAQGSAQYFFEKVHEVEKDFDYRFFEEVHKVILSLTVQGYKLGIISNRSEKSLLPILNDGPISKESFDLILNGSAPHLKPDSRAIKPFLELGWKLNEICFVGDTIDYDYQFAKNLGERISFISRTSILHSKEDFLQKQIPTECVINSLDEIFSSLEFLNRKEVA
jgi:HAD superfamily hydrolase (TIGR01549 family)